LYFCKKIILKKYISIAVLFFLASFSFSQNSVSYKVTGLKSEKAYLSAIYGSLQTIVDSCTISKGLIEFKNTSALPVGVYRISFEDSLYTDIIINNETIIMSNNVADQLDSIKIISSRENKVYYDYWRMSTYINDSVQMITKIGNAIYEANHHKLTPDLDSMARKAYRLTATLDSFTSQLINANPGLYASKLLKAYITPDWTEYKKTPGAKIYKNKSGFLKEHFFDNIDFSDSTLLNSEVFYVLCNDYLTRFVDPETDSNYIAAVDFILNKALPYQPVYKYILNLFVNTFSDTEWEETFIHLIDNYVLKNTCGPGEHDKKMSERAAALKRLKPGNKAPEIILNDVNGTSRNLYEINAKVILIMFWSSECEHCEEVIPQIIHIYSVYKPLGLEVFAVSVDTDRKSWTNAVSKNGSDWINVSDLKGFQSPVIAAYNAYSTPTFYLLDAEKKIISHPYSPKQMSDGLQNAFGK